MACENEKWKQRNLIEQVLTKGSCLFADVTQIADDDFRKCVVHDQACAARSGLGVFLVTLHYIHLLIQLNSTVT